MYSCGICRRRAFSCSMDNTFENITDLTLNAIENIEMDNATTVTIVCGAGLGVGFGIPTFNGKNGILQSREAAEKVIAKSYDNAYVRYRDRDNEMLCGVKNADGSRTEVLFKHILSNDCLDRLPVFFYSFLGCYFSDEILENARRKAKNITTGTYIDFIETLMGYCDVKHKRCNIFTLNIDGTLDAMGIKATEIHGRMGRNKCSQCGSYAVGSYPYIPRSIFSGTTEEYLNSYKCPHCGGYIRPEIVLMDENESGYDLASLKQSVQASACVVSIGVNERNHIGQFLASEAKIGGRQLIVIKEDSVTVVK